MTQGEGRSALWAYSSLVPREPSLRVLQIHSEGRILSFFCAFAGWTR